MKTGYYRLLVRCDAEGCQKRDVEITGADEEHAEAQAREKGWSLGNRDYCKEHAS